MRRIAWLGVWGTCMLFSNVRSAIYSVDSFNPLKRLLPSLNADSLVIFDIDKVLLIEKDPWERRHRVERKKAKTVATLFVKGSPINRVLTPAKRDRLWTIYDQALQERFVESSVALLIKKLQEKPVKVIALTRFLVGKVGDVNAIEDIRLARLRSMGLNFSESFARYPYIKFTQFSFENRHPVFKEGVLFTSHACSKGDLLKAFLQTIQWKPKNVVMFDDKLENLQSVQAALQSLHIPFQGFEYTGASKLPAFFDKNIAELQMKYLIDHEQWIHAKQAKNIIKRSK